MSLLFEIPSKIAVEVLTVWLMNHDAEQLMKLDQAICNETWRPKFFVLLHSTEFVIQDLQDCCSWYGEERRQSKTYWELMNIKLKDIVLQTTTFSFLNLFSLNISALESIGLRSCYVGDVKSQQGIVNFINAAVNIKKLDPLNICGSLCFDGGGVDVRSDHRISKKVYEITAEEQASYLVKIHGRVLKQLTHIGFKAGGMNAAPEIIEFVKMINIHCTSLLKLRISARNIPDPLYWSVIQNNVGLTDIHIGQPGNEVSNLLVSLCLKTHGAHLKSLIVACKVMDVQHCLDIREEIMSHMTGPWKCVLKYCDVYNQDRESICQFQTKGEHTVYKPFDIEFVLF